jgi:hypothetical protein
MKASQSKRRHQHGGCDLAAVTAETPTIITLSAARDAGRGNCCFTAGRTAGASVAAAARGASSEGNMSDYFTGSEWSQTYAKKALPVLVNFAERGKSLSYMDLAKLLLGDKKYAYALMAALGRLGKALRSLSKAEAKSLGKIPPIQLLVCNQRTMRPGNLALGFLEIRKSLADQMSKHELDSVVRVAHQRIFSYPSWHGVLKALGLKPLTLKLPASENVLPEIRDIERRATAESDEHKRLKLFLARNSRKIGVQWEGIGDTERLLLSGDRLDISFRDDQRWIAVEVKGKRSPEADLIRGIFQCVKYRAILVAQLRYEGLEGRNHFRRTVPRVILACGTLLPEALRALAESFDVEVKAGISVPNDFVP